MRTPFFGMLLSGLLLAGCAEQKQESPAVVKEKQKPTVFYLVRHAEKDRTDPENRNPELTPEGRERALYWKDVFKEVPLSAVYSTNYERTLQTAGPTAGSKELEVILYAPDTTNLKRWGKAMPGQHILIVGHSNTTPALANQLVGEGTYADIDDSNNGNLYIVHFGDEVSSSVLCLEPTRRDHRETP